MRLGLWAAILLAAPSAYAADAPQIGSPHAVLIDAQTGTVLFEKGADDLVDPASTSKIMTADLVFDLIKAGKLPLEKTFVISDRAWRQGGAPSHGSTMFAKLNSQVSVDDLLHGLIVDSANDAAIALAEGIAGSQGAFATRMTARARELGFEKLTFTDAWGDENPDQKVTAREMAHLSAHVIKTYPELYKMFGLRDFLWNKIKQPNRNPLLNDDIGADGLKTGNIGDSGYSLIGSAVQNGERLIVSIYGSKTAGERAEDAKKLLQWGFRSFEMRKVFAAGDEVGQARVYGGTEHSVSLLADRDIAVLVPRDGGEHLVAKIAYFGPLAAPVAENAVVARLELFRGNAQILTAPLRTSHAVGVGSLPQRAFDAALEYVRDVFRTYVLRS